MIERFWRSLTHECVFLNRLVTGSDMRAGIARWHANDTSERPHSTQGMLPPMGPSQQNKANENSSRIETTIHPSTAENRSKPWQLYCGMGADNGGESH